MMRGLDTNVVVRFVTKDDEAQFKRANAIFSGAASTGEKLFINAITLCEVVWVLRSAYDEPRKRVVEVLEALLETPEVVIEDIDLARRAVSEFANGVGDFADYFMARRNQRLGCDTTLTFDKALRRSKGLTQL